MARAKPKAAPAAKGERIAKRIARAGLCSRREAEAWITQGRVAVNGTVLTSPACVVGAGDTITVDGAALPDAERTRLFLFNKPQGLVTTTRDPEGRPTVFQALPADTPRLISVGRLDIATEGLLLLTNNGGLARALELPANAVTRRYKARVRGRIAQDRLDTLAEGVTIDGVAYRPIDANLLPASGGANLWVELTLTEGKNREVRRVLDWLGLSVNRLIRTDYGRFALDGLARGGLAEVPAASVEALLTELGLPGDPPAPPKRPRAQPAPGPAKSRSGKPMGQKPATRKPGRPKRPARGPGGRGQGR